MCPHAGMPIVLFISAVIVCKLVRIYIKTFFRRTESSILVNLLPENIYGCCLLQHMALSTGKKNGYLIAMKYVLNSVSCADDASMARALM